MLKIKVSSSEEKNSDILIRQTPDQSGIWKNCKFYVNKDVDNPDWWFVLHGSGLSKRKKTYCDPSKIVYISLEASETQNKVSQDFLNQFSKIVISDQNIVHRDIKYHNGITWYVGITVKTFIYLSWKQLGYSIRLNSGHRSQASQTKLYNAWIERGKTGLPALKTPGYHGTGMAIDFNFNTMGKTLPTGESGLIGSTGVHSGQTDATNKMMWEQSGIVQLAKNMGLEWGGDFRSYYDPIHIQWLPTGWTHSDVIMHANNPTKASVETTAGSGIGNEYEGSAEANMLEDLESANETFPEELIGAANLAGESETEPSWYDNAINNADDPNDLNQNGVPDSSEDYTEADDQFWEEHPDYPYAY